MPRLQGSQGTEVVGLAKEDRTGLFFPNEHFAYCSKGTFIINRCSDTDKDVLFQVPFRIGYSFIYLDVYAIFSSPLPNESSLQYQAR